MVDKGSTSRKRILVLGLTFFGWFLINVFRLFYVQVLSNDKYKQKLTRQNERVLEVSSERGTILDRNRRPLAMNADGYSFYLENRSVEESLKELARFQSLFSYTPSETKRLESMIRQKRSFIWLKRKVSEEEKERAISLGFENISYITEKRRLYPNRSLACHILGAVDIDNKGVEGVERKADEYLRGKSGRVLIHQDARRKVYEMQVLEPPRKGDGIVLTIDSVIQHIAEKSLRKAVEEYHADGGSVTVMSPFTGEILAMASYPYFDPNERLSLNGSTRSNKGVEFSYEPGSTFKVVSSSTLLELSQVKESEQIYCENGHFLYKGKVFTDTHPYGYLTLKEIMTHSSNIGIIKLALLLDKEKFYGYQKSFGIGQSTGVELPGEAGGSLRRVDRWSGLTLPSMSIGYEVMVTPLQMLLVMNTVATGGWYVPPTILRNELPLKNKRARYRVISSETASRMKGFLASVVEEGTGKAGGVEGFLAGGKTGTARKLVGGHYSQQAYVSSFIGFIPLDKPLLSIAVVIDNPKGGVYYGGAVSAPVFQEIASDTLTYLKIFPDPSAFATPILAANRPEEVKR